MRAATATDVDRLAAIWYEGWREVHLPILPAALAQVRTVESFRSRLREALDDTRVAGAPGAAAGFCIVKGDELYQLYVAADARRSGAATALLADAEARLRSAGVRTTWLACAIGNDRAAAFYERRGWHRAGTMFQHVDTPDGVCSFEVWRYEKSLAGG